MTWLQRTAKYPYIVYALLAVIVLGPLLKHGYVLTLDMVFTPQTQVPSLQAAGFPFYGFLWILNLVLPGDVVQKLVLLAIITLSGTGTYMLTHFLRPSTQFSQVDWTVPALFAGLLYICNPFVYSRFMAGQFMVLLGYALLPFFVWIWLVFLRNPQMRTAVGAAGIAAAIAAVSLHTLGMVLLFAVISSLVAVVTGRADRQWLRRFLRTSFVSLAAFVAVASYWIIPFVQGQGRAAELIKSFTGSDQAAFATAGHGWGKLANILTLQGFWGDARNLYVTPRELYGWWLVVLIAVLLFVILGFIRMWQTNKRTAAIITSVMSFAIILACGTQGTIFASFNQWLTDIVPIFAGYREPQKFVMLLALGYAVLAAFGLADIWQYLADRKHSIKAEDVAAFVVVIAALFAPLMLWGFHGQLQAREYPHDWYAVNQLVKSTDSVLFLPWHQYMRFSFAHNRNLANPADRFFNASVITSSNPELAGLDHWQNTPEQQVLESHVLPAAQKGDKTLARDLRQLHVSYIMLAKEYDYQRYSYVHQQPGLQLVYDSPTIELYRVK